MNVVSLRPAEHVTVFLRPAYSITVQKGELGARAALARPRRTAVEAFAAVSVAGGHR